MLDIQVEDLPDNGQQVAEPAAHSADTSEHLVLAQRFEVDSPSKTEENKLREVWEYARNKATVKDLQNTMWEVIHLEGVLGAPRLGESRLDRLYRYCKLKRQEAQIQYELKNVATSNNL